MSGLQTIINSAQDIDISRASMVATSVSRSGRLLTAARNWVKPWKFTVSAKPYWHYDSDTRAMIEEILTLDRHTEKTIYLGANAGSAWTIAYQGAGVFGATGFTFNTASAGTNLVLNLGTANAALPTGTVLFRAGDIVQAAGDRYPYAVTATVLKPATGTTVTVVTNRGLITSATAGTQMVAGVNCSWVVKVSKLPTTRLLPGRLVEFTSEFELVESVI